MERADDKPRELTCICCPMGCRMQISGASEAYRVTGNTCPRGAKYAVQELTDPRRVVTALVRVIDGERPVCAVKTREAVPKAQIGDVLAAIAALRIQAPVRRGDVFAQGIGGTQSDLIATADDGKK